MLNPREVIEMSLLVPGCWQAFPGNDCFQVVISWSMFQSFTFDQETWYMQVEIAPTPRN